MSFQTIAVKKLCNLHLFLALFATGMMIFTSLNNSKIISHSYFPPHLSTNATAKFLEITAFIDDLALQYKLRSQAKLGQCFVSLAEQEKAERRRTTNQLNRAEASMRKVINAIKTCQDNVRLDCEIRQNETALKSEEQDKAIQHNRDARLARFRFQRMISQDFVLATENALQCVKGPCTTGDVLRVMEMEKSVILGWKDIMQSRVEAFNRKVGRHLEHARQILPTYELITPLTGIPIPDFSQDIPDFALPTTPNFPDFSRELDRAMNALVAKFAEAKTTAESRFETMYTAAKIPLGTLLTVDQNPVSFQAAEDWIQAGKDMMNFPTLVAEEKEEELAPTLEIMSSAKLLLQSLAFLGGAFFLQADAVLRGLRIASIAWNHWKGTRLDPRPVDARTVMKKRKRALRFLTSAFHFVFVSAVYFLLFTALAVVFLKVYAPFYQDYQANCVVSRATGTMEARNAISIALRMANAKVPMVNANHTFQIEHAASAVCANGTIQVNAQLKALEQEVSLAQNALNNAEQCNPEGLPCLASNASHLYTWKAPVEEASFRCEALLTGCDLDTPTPAYEDLAKPIIDAFCDLESDFHFDAKIMFLSVFMYCLLNVLRVSLNYSFYLLTLRMRRANVTDMVWEASAATGIPKDYNPVAWRVYLEYLDSRNLFCGLFMLALSIIAGAIIIACGANFDAVLAWSVEFVDAM